MPGDGSRRGGAAEGDPAPMPSGMSACDMRDRLMLSTNSPECVFATIRRLPGISGDCGDSRPMPCRDTWDASPKLPYNPMSAKDASRRTPRAWGKSAGRLPKGRAMACCALVAMTMLSSMGRGGAARRGGRGPQGTGTELREHDWKKNCTYRRRIVAECRLSWLPARVS